MCKTIKVEKLYQLVQKLNDMSENVRKSSTYGGWSDIQKAEFNAEALGLQFARNQLEELIFLGNKFNYED